MERIEKRLKLAAELAGFLRTDRVDLIIMNDAAHVINFEIMKPNVPVFVRDDDIKLDVEQKIMSRYLDRKHHEDFLNRAFLKQIREKGGF